MESDNSSNRSSVIEAFGNGDVVQRGRPKSIVAAEEKCSACTQRVYPLDKLVISSASDNLIFHKACFKCKECKKTLSIGNYAPVNGVYYCKVHYKRLFKEHGNYDEGFGHEQHKHRWSRGNSFSGNSADLMKPSSTSVSDVETITEQDHNKSAEAAELKSKLDAISVASNEELSTTSHHGSDSPVTNTSRKASVTSKLTVGTNAPISPITKSPLSPTEHPTCGNCEQRVYPMDMIKMDDTFFHKLCFKCSHCNTLLGIGKFSHYQGKYYCKPHFSQLFKSKGNYDEGFGHQQHKDQWKNKSETSGASA